MFWNWLPIQLLSPCCSLKDYQINLMPCVCSQSPAQRQKGREVDFRGEPSSLTSSPLLAGGQAWQVLSYPLPARDLLQGCIWANDPKLSFSQTHFLFLPWLMMLVPLQPNDCLRVGSKICGAECKMEIWVPLFRKEGKVLWKILKKAFLFSWSFFTCDGVF